MQVVRPNFVPHVQRGKMIMDGLIRCHTFHENAGETVYDVSGNGRHLTYSGSVDVPDWTGSEKGTCLRIQDNSTWESTNEDLSVYGTEGSIVVLGRLVPPVGVTGGVFVGFGGASSGFTFDGYWWMIAHVSGGEERLQTAGVSDNNVTATVNGLFSSDPFTGAYDSIAVTGDGTTLRQYINGIQQTNTTPVGSGAYTWIGSISLTAPVKMVVGGRYKSGAFSFEDGDFEISEIRIYSRTLSSDELKLITAGLG